MTVVQQTPQSLKIPFFMLIALSLCVSFASFSTSSHAASADAKITGVIIVQSPGSVRIKNSDTEMIIHTGRETQFDPAGYRSQLGDTVKIEYYQKVAKDGKTMYAATKLELLKKNPSKPDLASPAGGKIIEAGRKWIKIHVDQVNDVVLFEKIRGTQFTPPAWQPATGDTVTVTFKRIPSRFGNLYTNQILGLEKIE